MMTGSMSQDLKTESLAKTRAHSCGNCIMWSLPPGRDIGACEIGDMQPLQGFDGNGVMKDDNVFWTTADTYCDHQVPIPPPGPPCPKCGEPTVEGFGLAGGGYGAYEYCEAEGCGYFHKHPEMPEDWE